MEINFKKMILSGLCLISLSVPFSLQAANLTIKNETNRDSTSIINHGACSTILGSSGVTKAHTTNVVSESTLLKACFLNRTNCQADVYMSNNCSGQKVATAIFDVYTGLKSVQVFDSSYTFDGNAFSIIISGGPANK